MKTTLEFILKSYKPFKKVITKKIYKSKTVLGNRDITVFNFTCYGDNRKDINKLITHLTEKLIWKHDKALYNLLAQTSIVKRDNKLLNYTVYDI